jgi:Glycosyltransferase family 87
VASAIFSFPLLFLLDRANIEGLVWAATAAGLYCFATRRYALAAVFLSLATSMKVFPGVLLLLFLAKRRYRDLALSAVLYGAFTVGSLWVTGPSIGEANRGIAMGIDYFLHFQILQFRPLEIGFDHTVYSLIKWVILFSVPNIPHLNAILPRIYAPYAVATVLGFGAIYGLRLRKLPVLNQVLALSAISVTLPFVSYEYALVHLIVPFILFVVFLVEDVATGRVVLRKGQILAILLPFVLILGPLSFLILMYGVGFGGQIKALALIYLIGASMKVRFPSSIFGELDADCQGAIPITELGHDLSIAVTTICPTRWAASSEGM